MKFVRFVLIFSAILAIVGGPGPAEAAPWQWMLTLNDKASGRPMRMPTAMYIDAAAGRYYVVDAGNNRLLSFQKDGEFISAFDAGGGLEAPFDMVKDRKGRLWIVERKANSLTMIDLPQKLVERHKLSNRGMSLFPARVEIEDDTIYVLDKATGRVFKLDDRLNVTDGFACKECANGFIDFKIREGSLWALERNGRTLCRFTTDGSLAESISLDDVVRFPYSLEVGHSGIVYVLDRHEGDIAVFSRDGTFKYRFLTPGQARGGLYFPAEISIDPWDRLCVVEEGNGRVEVFAR
jgi:sugar lactone lactonase YvrE